MHSCSFRDDSPGGCDFSDLRNARIRNWFGTPTRRSLHGRVHLRLGSLGESACESGSDLAFQGVVREAIEGGQAARAGWNPTKRMTNFAV